MFRVVSVTSLYIAIKLHATKRRNITAREFAQLCQGAVTGQEIIDIEIKILFALNWNVNPPIPMQYAQELLELIFNPSSSRMCISLPYDWSFMSEMREHILELVSYQLEITTLYDKGLHLTKSSIIAIAAVLNALQGVVYEGVGGSTFCQQSMALVLDVCHEYRIASEEELEDIRSILLSSVVSSGDDKRDKKILWTATGSRCNQKARCMQVLTPQNVLQKLLVFH